MPFADHKYPLLFFKLQCSTLLTGRKYIRYVLQTLVCNIYGGCDIDSCS